MHLVEHKCFRVILILASFILCSCNDNDSDDSNKYPRRSENDLQLLKEYFDTHNGKLFPDDEQTVLCKLTKHYRIYEFSKHTVIVYPVNWSTNNISAVVCYGKFKNDKQIYWNLSKLDSKGQGHIGDYLDNTPLTEVDRIRLRKVSIYGLSLLMKREHLLNSESNRINRLISDDGKRNNALGLIKVGIFQRPGIYGTVIYDPSDQIAKIDFQNKKSVGIGAIGLMGKIGDDIDILEQKEINIGRSVPAPSQNVEPEQTRSNDQVDGGE